jgi:serine phosphatase RsbU (regulator of sigma subunit)
MISEGEATGIGPQNGRTPAVGPGLRTEVGVVSDPLRALLTSSHLLAPDRLADTVAAHARDLGARETVLYLVDYQQLILLPLPGAGVPQRQELPIEGTLAGRAFRRLDAVAHSAADGRHHLWVPLLDGVERLGVAELVFAAEPSADQHDQLLAYVTLVAELLVVNDAYTDLFARLRRRKTLSLAAEIQWELLPPLTFGTDRLVITGGLEPAYEIGGDSFDYAVNLGTADLLVLDSVGHGLPAAVLAAVAVGAYRHARRNAGDLPDIAAEVNAAIAVQFGHSQFATAVLARLDVDTGRLRWINAGHPQPLIVRGSSVVHPPHCPPARPLGLQEGRPLCCETRLEPGDRLLLYTDGIVEARSPDGEFFGERRLADFVKAAVADGEPAPETVRRLLRRLLAHQADQLQDDASIVVLEWHTGHARQLQP